MSRRERDPLGGRGLDWFFREHASARGSAARLLEVDPELAAGVRGVDLPAARAAGVARTAFVEPPATDAPLVPDCPPGALLLILEGLVVRRVRGLRAESAELLGPGDVVHVDEADGAVRLLAEDIAHEVLQPITVAILDIGFFSRIAPWPSIASAIAARAGRRARTLAVQLMAADARRVDTRIVLLLALLAERWGVVAGEGVHVPVPLSHRELGELIGASRSAVCLGAGRLDRAGIARRTPHGWLLCGHAALRQRMAASRATRLAGESAVA